MFDLDVGKMLVFGIVALAVIPPKDLPRVMRTVGKYVGQMRRMASDFQGQFMDAMKEADVDERQEGIRGDRSAAKIDSSFDPVMAMRSEMTKAVEEPDAAGRNRRRFRSNPNIDRRGSATPLSRSCRKWSRRPCCREPDAEPVAVAIDAPSRTPERRSESARGEPRSMTDADIEATKAPLMDHIIELRQRLIRALYAFFAAFLVCFYFSRDDLQHPDLALRAGGGGGEGDADRDPLPRAVLHQRAAQHVRRGRHRVSGHRDADLPLRRARPLQARASRRSCPI